MDGPVNGTLSSYRSGLAGRFPRFLAAAVASAAIVCLGAVGMSIGMSKALAHEGVGPATCDHLPGLEAWLSRHAERWDAVLSAEPGYERPAHVDVCRLDGRWPFADNRQDRVYVRRLETTDDQVTLAHEYLHLAFKHFPSGHDEHYVETTARRLVADYP
jgi:uncharacterized protein YfaQ (DUF2300 family)